MENTGLKISFIYFLAAVCAAEKQLWNEKTDILLSYFSIGYKSFNSTDIPIMDIINGSVSICGMHLGDITTIKRMSDVILQTKPNGDTRISGVFGLGKFELKITNARYENYSGPAIITCKDNSANIAYTIKSPDKVHSCKTKWENFTLGDFSDLKVFTPFTTNEQPANLTETFNQRILPALNHYFNTQEFLAAMSRTFDFCTFKKNFFPF